MRYAHRMKRLAFFMLFTGMSFSAGCTSKSNESSTDTESPDTMETTDTTEPTADSDGSTTTSESTTSDQPDETTDDTTGTTAPPVDEDCAFLVGKEFVSTKQTPCGPPDGDEPGPLCPETVSFTADTFSYISGDFGVSGSYTCEAGVIVGEDDIGDPHKGTIDATSGVLEWDGDKFHVE